jgi:hypothetical protein
MEYLETERQVYENMLQTLENFERGSASIDLKPIEQLLQMLETVDVQSTPDYTSKRMVQTSIFLDQILRDLIYLVKNSDLSSDVKKNWINKLQSLLSRTEKKIQEYYDYYGYLPKYLRYYSYWLRQDRQRHKCLPYCSESYYYDKYPSKTKELSDTEVIWRDITSKQQVTESSGFVPKTFLCDDASQYQEYVLLKLHDELKGLEHKTTLSDEIDNDKLHRVADGIIKQNRRVFTE